MTLKPRVEEEDPAALVESALDYGPHPPRPYCGCADRLTQVEHEIEVLHRLYRAGEICESTYRHNLMQLESELAVLSRAF